MNSLLRLPDRAGSVIAGLAVTALTFGLSAPALSAYCFEDDFQWLTTRNTSRYLYTPAVGFSLRRREELRRPSRRLRGVSGPGAVRLEHPAITPAAVVPAPPLPDELHQAFVQAMIQWDHQAPGIQLMFAPAVVRPAR